MTLPNILIIDSSIHRLSVSLVNMEDVLVNEYSIQTNIHAKMITVFIRNVLNKAKLTYKDLSAIALNKGPGSFTGLRVGSSTAKGLCFALDIPLIAVDGLKEYAEYIYEQNKSRYSDVFLMLDARRGNYFFSHKNKNQIATNSNFLNEKEIEVLVSQSQVPMKVIINPSNSYELRSEWMKKAVFNKFENKEFEDLNLFEPLYLLNNYQKQK